MAAKEPLALNSIITLIKSSCTNTSLLTLTMGEMGSSKNLSLSRIESFLDNLASIVSGQMGLEYWGMQGVLRCTKALSKMMVKSKMLSLIVNQFWDKGQSIPEENSNSSFSSSNLGISSSKQWKDERFSIWDVSNNCSAWSICWFFPSFLCT